MYIDAFLDRNDDLVKVVERHPTGRTFVDLAPVYNYYVPDPSGPVVAVDGNHVSERTFNSAKDFYSSIKEAKNLGMKLYESDFSVLYKTLYKHYNTQAVPEPNKLFFDIEADFDEVKGYAPIDDPFNKVTAISMYRCWMDELIVLTIKPPTYTEEQAQSVIDDINSTHRGKVYLCESEELMLMLFLELLADADTLSGWNSACYDVPYLVNRILRILGKDYLKKFSLWNNYPQERETENYGNTIITYDFIGRVHLDYLVLYKKHNPQVKQSYKLDDIGMEVTGERKVPHDETLDQLYKQDYKRFLEYSLQDSWLLYLIDKKLNYVVLHTRLAHQECVTLKSTLGSVDLIDTAIVNQIHRRGQICFNKPDVPVVFDQYDDDDVDDTDDIFEDVQEEKTEPKAAGAWVQDPRTGLVQWLAVTDLNSLYPSTLRALNMSTEGIVGQIRPTYTDIYLDEKIQKQRASSRSKNFKPDWTAAWHGLFGTLEFNMVRDKTDDVLTVDFETGDTVTCYAKDLYELLYSETSEYVLSANGTIFDKKTPGIIPEVLAKWYSERKMMQGAMNNYKHLMDDGMEIPLDMLNDLME